MVVHSQSRTSHVKLMKGFGGVRRCWRLLMTMMATPIAPYMLSSFAAVLYLLHAFQKKSKKGNETPKSDMDLVKLRLQGC